MNILGIDSSAVSASAAVVSNGKVISESYINTGLTHSQTLLTLIDQSLKNASFTVNDIDLIAVTNGPGSFTGIRIGIATAKGLAAPTAIPCFAVSTLEAIAYPFKNHRCTALAVMDARCSQAYTAMFKCGNNEQVRISEDDALLLETLKSQLTSVSEKIVICGDGAQLVYDYLKEHISNIEIAAENNRYQKASSAALIAEREITLNKKSPVNASLLHPFYLRVPQAERELSAKLEKK